MNKFWALLLWLGLLIPASAAKAQQINPVQLPEPNATEQNLLSNGDFSAGLASWSVKDTDILRARVVDVTGDDGIPSKALRAELKVKPETKPWEAPLHQPIPLTFKAGEKLLLRGRARSSQSLAFYTYLEESSAPFGKQATVKLTLSPDWQEFEARGVLTRDFAPNEMRVGFQLASGNGTIEIADLVVTRSPPDPEIKIDNSVLALNGDFTSPLENSWVATARVPIQSSIIDVKIGPNSITSGSGKALRVEVETPADANLWEARISPPKPRAAIKKGDMILVEFWGRSDRKNRISPVFQQAMAPYNKSLIEIAYLSPEWKKFTYYTRAAGPFAPGESSFEIQIGGVRGSVELAEIRVENRGDVPGSEMLAKFGPRTIDYFGGETPNDDWKLAAQERIEKYRKGDVEILVVDARGMPVPNAKVDLVQTRQAFRFGTAVNSWLLSEGPDGDRYRAQVKRLFNTAVLENDMKWRLTDTSKEAEKRGIESVKWLRANGLEVRGHTMLWGSWRHLPPNLEKMPPEKARAEIKKRVFEASKKFQGQLYVWDVVNEAVTNTEVFDKLGWDLFPQVFKWAREADKDTKFAYNDYDISNEGFNLGKHRTKAEARIQQLIDAGAPVDILGDQGHMFTPFPLMPRLLEIWDDWGKKYGKPIEITEFDAAISDGAVHEKYVRDYMTAAFSNPNIESFILWGFWSKAHWRGTTASLFRDDWTPRPAAAAVEDLILKQWKTNLSLVTDNRGSVKTRGFLGDYEIRVSVDGRNATATAKLTKSGLVQTVVLN